MKAERIKSFKRNSEEECEGFLQQIARGDKTWDHHHYPENKRQSMEYHYKGSQVPKNFQNQSLCCKSQVDCILELWRCCAHRLPGKEVLQWTQNAILKP